MPRFALPLMLFALTLGPSTALAGPFGTVMGDQPAKYENYKKFVGTNPYVITCYEMPEDASLFDEYMLTFGELGLESICAIKDYSKSDEPFPNEGLDFSKVQARLEKLYGKPGLDGGYMSQWRGFLPDDLKSVHLWLSWPGEGKGPFLYLAYFYRNSGVSK